MAFIRTSRGARGQRPAGPMVLNRASSQGLGLADCFTGAVADGVRTLQSGPLAVVGTFDAPVARPIIGGPLYQNNQAGGNNTGLQNTTRTMGSSGDSYSVSVWAYQSQAHDVDRGIYELSSDALGGWSMRLNTQGAGLFRFSVVTTSGGATQFNVDSTVTYAPNTLVHLVGVWRAGVGLSIYQNGALVGTTTTTTTTLRSTVGFTWYGHVGATGGWAGNLCHGLLCRRALSAAEVWSLYEPSTRWDLYAVPSTRVYFDQGAAAAAFLARRPLSVNQAVNRSATF